VGENRRKKNDERVETMLKSLCLYMKVAQGNSLKVTEK
jgi:hypothetical protein